MNSKLKNTIVVLLPLQIVLVKWLKNYPALIETYYSNGIYQYISTFFRTLFGWISFSVGDILYALLIIISITYVIKNRKYIKQKPVFFLRNIGVVLSVAYFTFHLCWGLNYYRVPLHKTLQISNTHTEQELEDFVNTLIKKTNNLQFSITKDIAKAVAIPYNKSEIFKKTIIGYKALEKKYPFLKYNTPSLKSSLFSTGLTYAGYGGYLNPFTNEAQVNGKMPLYRFPVIVAHEAGHQIGYSAENETNFIGYLVTANNSDIYFKYAANSYALSYCLSDIKYNDEALFNALYAKLNIGVKENYQELSDFWLDYKNPMEPVLKSIYSTFLKANNQADGIKSYSKIVILLVTYHKKHPIK